MNMYLCKGIFNGLDVAWVLVPDERHGYHIEARTIGSDWDQNPTYRLGDGIDNMVISCNLTYADVLSRVQHAIHRLSVESRLASLLPRPAKESCSDTDACGQ